MPKLDPIALAIPVFLGAILAESVIARRKGLKLYRFFDAISDLSCGIGNQAIGLFVAAFSLFLYVCVYRHGAVVHYAGGVWPWVLGLVGLDFFYYWWHRASHEVNALWAAHIVHHQSEDYNLAVALRQAWFTPLTSLPFYLPLAILGVSPQIFIISNSVSLIYQFWIHTELIDRIDPFEWVLNTPSHHRVHHATNTEYLDRNYGAILIVWDRLFGSFEPERAPCVYGITKPFASTSPVWANFHYWVELANLSRASEGFGNKILTFVRRPGWNSKTGRVEIPPFTPRAQFRKFAPPRPSPGVKRYINANFLVTAAGVMALLLFHNMMGQGAIFAAVAAIVLSTVGWSLLIERRRWAPAFEVARIGGTVVALIWIWHSLPVAAA